MYNKKHIILNYSSTVIGGEIIGTVLKYISGIIYGSVNYGFL